MRLEDLVTWTPVALTPDLPTPSVDWGDLGFVRFSEPFFDQTVARWAGGDPPPVLVRTDFGVLAALDAAPSLDPTAIICHMSRCGSTLLSRLLGQLPGTLVVAEPAPLNALLLADPDATPDALKVLYLRQLVRAFGRRRFGDERRYILKLSSWNVRLLPIFRQAFPNVPVIWVQRTPTEVMASLVADTPGWLRLENAPLLSRRLFNIPPEAALAMGGAAYCARAVATLLESAQAATDGPFLHLDYTELPGAVWTRVADFLETPLSEIDVARMRDQARYYSKDPSRRPYAGDTPDRCTLRRSVSALAAEYLDPLYRDLARRRAA